MVSALERDIADGRLSDGDCLPPHLELARELGLSVGTVSKAYQKAEQRGISGHVGQGSFVRRHSPRRPRWPRHDMNRSI
ncbi:GntR family transcriptional regulator [Bradyrhizobium sp. U531]|uniref:GntR family transcriptional regulator n=1 Tax=Bradyrhizobium sp. U531 TaxID=3053458 RepID=UPI003F68704E